MCAKIDDRFLDLLSVNFGMTFHARVDKLKEEFGELMNVIDNEDIINDDKRFMELLIDEMADVNVIIFHIAGLLGLSQTDLLNIAKDKIVGRLKDPNYKRYHKHFERIRKHDEKQCGPFAFDKYLQQKTEQEKWNQ